MNHLERAMDVYENLQRVANAEFTAAVAAARTAYEEATADARKAFIAVEQSAKDVFQEVYSAAYAARRDAQVAAAAVFENAIAAAPLPRCPNCRKVLTGKVSTWGGGYAHRGRMTCSTLIRHRDVLYDELLDEIEKKGR